MHRKTAQRLAAAALLACTAAVGCAPEPRPAPPAIDPQSLRITRSGDLVGFVGAYGSHVWLGIPFAKPPVGELRWRAPQPPEPWSGTLQALEHGSPCPQLASPLGGVDGAPGRPTGDEDCLYLNVYAPRVDARKVPRGGGRLPVMVWIHGGGNVVGHGGFYDGGRLAQSQDVVVVTVNYRLGPLGWFRHAALRGEGTSEADRSGNFGTLDLVRALEWIRRHVTAFGGDPGNVTIFGESAGARDVFTLLLSPQAEDLFHRAIAQSGATDLTDVATAEHFVDDPEPGHPSSANETILKLLIADASAADRAGAKARLAAMAPDELAQYLRRKSAVELLETYDREEDEALIDLPKVFADGFVLPDGDALERFARADGYNAVPVMLGTNRDENKLFMFFQPRWVRRILWVFPRLVDADRYNVTAEYLSKIWKATGADGPAAVLRQTQGPNVFVYRFDWDEEPTLLGADLSMMLGAAHGFEIPFVFGHFDLGREGNIIFTDANEPARQSLAEQMMSYWAQFAYTGAPGRGRKGDLPKWLPWDPSASDAPKYMVLDTPRSGGLRMSSHTVSEASVIAQVDEDPRLPTQRDRCAVYRELARWSRGFDQADYPTAGKLGCAAYPFDTVALGE
ncbi:MAG: carboxylesterase family protein [Deltaproteobacteria bacterium]|nr:MAG: carboxylesterase family protein [Deltaproteobacteria bacterium]